MTVKPLAKGPEAKAGDLVIYRLVGRCMYNKTVKTICQFKVCRRFQVAGILIVFA
jgi:hypothetical protein